MSHPDRLSAPNDPSHRILRYVLKIGDMEEAVHCFIDLLRMKVLSHHEFSDGSPDGDDVHYEGPWSRTLVGYSSAAENNEICIQLTVIHGIDRYERGNHLYSIEVEVKNVYPLVQAGLKTSTIRGKEMFTVSCDGYKIEVVESTDKKDRISRIILACYDDIYPSSKVCRFWTECLGFNISSWSCKLTPEQEVELDHYMDSLQEDSIMSALSMVCCCCPAPLKLKNLSKQLLEGEEEYIEMQYGSSLDFSLRLQKLPQGVERIDGGSRESFMMTGTANNLKQISNLLKTLGRTQGGKETRKDLQFVPGKETLHGIVINDPSELEVCFFDDVDVRSFGSEIQQNAEPYLRKCIVDARKKRLGERESVVKFHVFGVHAI